MSWTFSDPLNGDSLTLIIGPEEGVQAGGITKTEVQTGMDDVVDGADQPVLLEGGSGRREIEFSGRSANQSQYTSLEYWYQKSNVVVLTDDLGTEWHMYITGLEAPRILSHTEQWYFSWTLRALEA